MYNLIKKHKFKGEYEHHQKLLGIVVKSKKKKHGKRIKWRLLIKWQVKMVKYANNINCRMW